MRISRQGAPCNLPEAGILNEHRFAVLMEATEYCSPGPLTAAMFGAGGAASEEHAGTCRTEHRRRVGVPPPQ